MVLDGLVLLFARKLIRGYGLQDLFAYNDSVELWTGARADVSLDQ